MIEQNNTSTDEQTPEQIAADINNTLAGIGSSERVVLGDPQPSDGADTDEPSVSPALAAWINGDDIDPTLIAMNNATAHTITSSAPEVLADDLPDPQPKVITGAFINTAVMGVRAPFEAKKKRGAAFKGARKRLDKMADAAVFAFGAEHLPELSTEQLIKISLGEAGLVGDSMRGFEYVEG